MTGTGRPAGPPAPPPMDPRFRRRRIEVRRDEGRRRLRLLVACLSAAAAVGAGAGATRSPLLDVDRVEVRGATRTSRSEVVAAGGLGGRRAMTAVDVAAVARRVEALPWVRRARAERRWPSTVVVTVTEREPAAAAPAPPGWAAVDATGRVLEIGPERPAGLPALAAVPAPGPPGSSLDPAAAVPLRVAAALPGALRTRVADVVARGGEVELTLAAPGGLVRLGPPVDLEAKLRSLTTVLTRADLANLAVVDVRVPRAPVLTRR